MSPRISFDPRNVWVPAERIRTIRIISGSNAGTVYEVRLFMYCPCKSFRFRKSCRHLTEAMRLYRENNDDPA